MKHIILDLETLSTENNALILSIGAVLIDSDSLCIVEHFYETIDLKSSMEFPFHISSSTLEWWFNQSKEAIGSTFLTTRNRFSVLEVLTHFHNWCKNINGPWVIWGNSDSFDCTILENAYKIVNLTCPFNYLQFRDFRTMRALFAHLKNIDDEDTDLILHNALDDAKWEAKYLIQIIKVLKEHVKINEF
jgi:hypothetical protein